MHISAIRKDTLHPSFMSGKTTLYTDFDGTYMPFSHNEICNDCDYFTRADELNSMHSKFKNFFSKFNDKLKLVITTGRSKNEYDYFVKHMENKNLRIQKPQELITRDGVNRYICANDNFEDENLRNKAVTKTTNIINTKNLKKDIEKIVLSLYPDALTVEAQVNKNKYEYKEKSLEKVLDSVNGYNKNNYVSFAQPEPLMLEIAVSPKYNLSKIKSEIENYLQQNEIKAAVKSYENESSIYLPVYKPSAKTYEPANIIMIKPRIDNKMVTKLYDVKNEIKNNIKLETNDLVIAAGDGINDEPMLNVLNYLDLYGINVDKSKSVEEILADEKVLGALRELPFCAIVCSKSRSLEHIRKMGKMLDSKGIHKIITNDNPKDYLLKNVKQAIKNYGDTNEEYFYSLGPEFYGNLFEY